MTAVTHLLEKAFKAAADLPDKDQHALGSRVLQEIAGGKEWDAALAKKRTALRSLAHEARADIQAGRVRELIPDDL